MDQTHSKSRASVCGFTRGGFGSGKKGPCTRVVHRGRGSLVEWPQADLCLSVLLRSHAGHTGVTAPAVFTRRASPQLPTSSSPSFQTPPQQRYPLGQCLGWKIFLYSPCKRKRWETVEMAFLKKRASFHNHLLPHPRSARMWADCHAWPTIKDSFSFLLIMSSRRWSFMLPWALTRPYLRRSMLLSTSLSLSGIVSGLPKQL